MMNASVCVVWCSSNGLFCQQFGSVPEAEMFATSVDSWAIVVQGDDQSFSGGLAVEGHYMPGMFGGVV